MVANREKYRAAARKRYAENPEKNRAHFRKVRYGLSPDAYQRILSRQGGVCAICLRPESRSRNGKTAVLAVDHSHASGAVRGLLCFACNVGLGAFRDSADRLRAAAHYLDHRP